MSNNKPPPSHRGKKIKKIRIHDSRPDPKSE